MMLPEAWLDSLPCVLATDHPVPSLREQLIVASILLLMGSINSDVAPTSTLSLWMVHENSRQALY